MQLHARAIDLTDLQAYAFEQAQATGVDHTQADAVIWASNLLDDPPDLLRSEHDRQLFGDGWTDEVAQWPGALKCVGVEKLDAIESHVGGVGGQAFLVAQIEEVPAQLVFGDQ